MSANGCLVRIPGAGLCGWERDGRHMECAAHRRRLRVHGDYLAHVPVTRKPSRRPEAVAERFAQRRVDAVTWAVTRAREAYAPVTDRCGALELA